MNGVIISIIVITLTAWVIYFIYNKKKHVRINFKELLDETKLPIISLILNDKKYWFLVDSGSNYSYIDSKILSEINWEKGKEKLDIYGFAGSSMYGEEVYFEAKIEEREKNIKLSAFTLDLSSTFMTVKLNHGIEISGILGTDFFINNKSKIDYDKKHLKIKCYT